MIKVNDIFNGVLVMKVNESDDENHGEILAYRHGHDRPFMAARVTPSSIRIGQWCNGFYARTYTEALAEFDRLVLDRYEDQML